MSTSIVFDLIDQLVTQFTADLPTVTVIDGDSVTGGYGNFLMVGWDDPDNDRATAAEGRQEWAGLGAQRRNEEGTVTCLAVSWNGNGSITEARDGVKAITAGVENSLRDDPNLGGTVPGLQWTGYGGRTELKQWLGETGATALCIFDIQYRARI